MSKTKPNLKTLLLFAVFLTCMLMYSAFGQLINSKPTAVPDTCRGKIINVLSNDTDPNNDPLTATKFNGTPIPNTGLAVDKQDTGTFILENNGQLTCKFIETFYGIVYLTYYVNDGKGSMAKKQTGSIVIIRSKPTGEITRKFGYILRNNDSCKLSKNKWYWVDVVYDTDTVVGYVFPRKGYAMTKDSSGKYIFEPVGYYYILSYTTKEGSPARFILDPEDFIYISNNACKE